MLLVRSAAINTSAEGFTFQEQHAFNDEMQADASNLEVCHVAARSPKRRKIRCLGSAGSISKGSECLPFASCPGKKPLKQQMARFVGGDA